MSSPNETTDLTAPPVSVLAVIERAASNKDIDVDKMRALLEMHEHVLNRNAEMAFSEAMTKAQSEMSRISTDATNPQTHSKYATYGKLDRALRPIYTANGFALSFGTGDSPLADYVRVVCDVSHGAGHRRNYYIDIPADGKGAKGGDVMTKTHAVGAGVSYGMRYLLKMIFNVAIGEDDKDGNTPEPNITEEQAATLQALIEEVKADKPKFLKYMKVGNLLNIPVSKYAAAVAALEKKRKEPSGTTE